MLLAAAAGGARGQTDGAVRGCRPPRADADYSQRVLRALAAREDVWGNALLSSPAGPTYRGVSRYLEPLLFARASRGALTDSGVYYLPFAQPRGAQGAGSVMLHVADGSEIAAERAGGRKLTVWVGGNARERYGSCLSRLAPARLAGGYLPILQTRYVDAAGVRYRQESFAARVPPAGALASFVRLDVDARRSAAGASVRLTGTTEVVPRGSARTFFVAWPRPLRLDPEAYDDARRSLIDFWRRRLSAGATFVVPEQRVLDAERNLLIQNLELTWRYSIGNAYEEFSFPESVDNAEVMAEYGFADVARAILRTSLTRKPTPYPNWKMGERLVATAEYYRLVRDRAFVEEVTPVLRGYVTALGRQLARGGILGRERYSSDIPDSVYGLHSQAVAWQGLRAMGRVWAATGERALAARCRMLAARLETGLRRAVRQSQRRLPDGSLFVPVRLLDGEAPYDALTASRAGSYWNLVMPYALASGLFPARGPQATGVLEYMLRHGSRFLGLVRAGAFALYKQPVYPTSGSDQVYGFNVARFLVDNDRAEQLVLSLYGQLAAGMTETFVAGEGATIAPLQGEAFRSMYLPPNSASNAAFLETLRLVLVHETSHGLELAYSTPRPWLRAGRRIEVREAPTSFGPLSYSIAPAARTVRVSLDVPSRLPPRTLRLRLRLPYGERITGVLVDGRPLHTFDARTQTLDLSGRRGRLDILAQKR